MANLSQIKKLIASGNNGMQQIITFNPLKLLGYSHGQITQLINTRSGNNITTAKSLEIKERINKTNE
ncbi:MAG: hypothetical protein WCL18_05965 [bacterium]